MEKNTELAAVSSEDGTVYSFGENKLGQLGQGSQTDAVLSPAPVSVASIQIVPDPCQIVETPRFSSDSSIPSSLIFFSQISYNGQPLVKVACGAEFSMVVDCKGNLYSFGCPEYGQLGKNYSIICFGEVSL